jgi:two-component system, LytTR family, response regulator LytT
MKIVLIEDESLTAEDLSETISRVEPAAEITAILSSVKEAVAWFKKNAGPDIIFSDIQLGDGLSFSIFQEAAISTPVIFCTAYDEYALRAFKANGIDYVLKPFTQKAIADAFDRYKRLKDNFSPAAPGYENLTRLFEQRTQTDAALLVYFKEKIVPVKFADIALFYIENEITHLITFDRDRYCVTKPMDELEKSAGKNFYRLNRKHLVNRNAVKDASQYFHRKLLINLSVPVDIADPITVSKEKAAHFLNWLSGT